MSQSGARTRDVQYDTGSIATIYTTEPWQLWTITRRYSRFSWTEVVYPPAGEPPPSCRSAIAWTPSLRVMASPRTSSWCPRLQQNHSFIFILSQKVCHNKVVFTGDIVIIIIKSYYIYYKLIHSIHTLKILLGLY